MTFAIHNLGCKVNTYETDAMICSLKDAGFEEKAFDEKADIYIINTCTVTNVADKKSRQMLHRARKMNDKAIVIAVGCYVDAALRNKEMSSLLSDSSVDMFLPNKDKGKIVEKIREFMKDRSEAMAEDCCEERKPGQGNNGKVKDTSPFGCRDEAFGMNVTEIVNHTRAFIKVQDGCNQFCSYCIIPYARGRIVSRPEDDCIREIRGLAEKGVKEVVLTGIHLSSYGKDLLPDGGKGPVCDDDFKDRIYLLELIKAIHDVEGIERIRIGSLEPHIITETFARELSGLEKFCPHFHLSLQSGSDTVLRRMNRHYTADDYMRRCEILRKYFEHPAITTDVITGFPGETEEEFRETLSFAEKIRFYEMHVFKYSRRAGTPADRMEGQIAEAVKSERSEKLIRLSEEMSEEFRRYYIGRDLEMLPEEIIEVRDKDGEIKRFVTGYTKEYVRTVKEAEAFEKGVIIRGKASDICKEKAIYESILLR